MNPVISSLSLNTLPIVCNVLLSFVPPHIVNILFLSTEFAPRVPLYCRSVWSVDARSAGKAYYQQNGKETFRSWNKHAFNTVCIRTGRGTGEQTLDDFNPFASFGGCFNTQLREFNYLLYIFFLSLCG